MGRRRPLRASMGRILAHPRAVLVAGIAGRQGLGARAAGVLWSTVSFGTGCAIGQVAAGRRRGRGQAGAGGGGRAYAGYIDRAALSREIPTE